jgi:hypothetical protein
VRIIGEEVEVMAGKHADLFGLHKQQTLTRRDSASLGFTSLRQSQAVPSASSSFETSTLTASSFAASPFAASSLASCSAASASISFKPALIILFSTGSPKA